MRLTTGGYRAHAFESIEAASKGHYFDTLVYVVEGLPGFWRRVKLPKGVVTEQGLLLCFFVDGIIALESATAMTDEFEQAADKIGTNDEATALAAHKVVEELTERRTEFLMRERSGKPDGAPVAEPVKPEGDPAAVPNVPAGAGDLQI